MRGRLCFAALHACHARQPQPRPCRERGKGQGREVPPMHAVPWAVVAGERAARAENERRASATVRAGKS
jgi:hypothetical protein